MARIRNYAGALVTQASVASITQVVTDLTLEKASPGSGFISSIPLVVANVIFDSLQIDLTWNKDGPNNPAPSQPYGDGLWGFNFATVVAAANFAATGHRYRVDCKFVPVAGEPFVLPFEWSTFTVYV